MARPDKLPEWASDASFVDTLSGQLNKIEPPAIKKQKGFIYPEKPPFNWFNYLFNKIYEWLFFVNDEIVTKTENQSISGVKTFSSNIVGNVTGNVTGNADTVTNGVYTIGNQTIGGVKTFSNTTEATTTTGALIVEGGILAKKKLVSKTGIILESGIIQTPDIVAIGNNVTADGDRSIAIGNTANATGNYSTAIGYSTLVSGYFSIAIGGAAQATGSSAIAIGGSVQAAGFDSTAIGNSSQANTLSSTAIGNSSQANGEYASAIGYAATTPIGTADYMKLGSVSTNIYVQNAINVISDERDKTDIQDNDLGLDFVMKLQTKKYRINSRENYYKKDKDNKLIRDKNNHRILDIEAYKKSELKGKRYHRGLIAQDVEKLHDTMDFAAVTHTTYKNDKAEDQYALNYEQFIPVLIKAIQEQQVEISNLKSELQELKNGK